MSQGASDEVKDLYKLLGNYERFTMNVSHRLEKGDERMERIEKAINGIETKCPAAQEQIISQDKRIKSLESNGIPKKQKDQLNATSLGTMLNLVFNFALQWKYGIGVVTAITFFLASVFS